MENAADALKIVFAIFTFVLALTIAIMMMGQLHDVSQVVLASSDQTTYYEYETFEEKSRTVGLETVIPTLYKYYKENYAVLFLDEKGTPLPLYKSQANISLWGSGTNSTVGLIGKYYTTKPNEYSTYDTKRIVCCFDVEEETVRHEPWTGSSNDFKLNLDAFLQGGYFAYPSGGTDDEGNTGYDYSKNPTNANEGFIEKYATRQFKEYLGEYSYNTDTTDNNSGSQKNRKKRIIIYQLLPK